MPGPVHSISVIKNQQTRGDAELPVPWLMRRASAPLSVTVMDRKLFLDTYLERDAAPPQYAAHGAGPSTSAYSAPPPYYPEQVRFPVGGKVPNDPFVVASQLKTHLGLLRVFRELKNRVTDLEANQDVHSNLPPLAQELGPQERWTWFLELALDRSYCVTLWLP